MEDFKELLAQAQAAYSSHFTDEAWFGRCIFLSFYCQRGTCTFCFRSVARHQERHAKNARRSLSSILAEALIIRVFDWRIEFVTGGYGILEQNELLRTLKLTSQALGQKLWVNLGAMDSEQLRTLQPYVEGIVSSIETTNPQLHDKVCPDKPIAPYEQMIEEAKKLGYKQSFTIIIGLGETKEDFNALDAFITKHGFDRITLYALRPVKGTPHTKGPTAEEMAWWIAKVRISHPTIEIIAGSAEYRLDEVPLLLQAGANAITKLPATKMFNTRKAQQLGELARTAGRKWTSTFSHNDPRHAADWEELIAQLDLTEEEQISLRRTLESYLHQMEKKKEEQE